VDLKDPANPTTITSDFGGIGTHDLNTSKDGNRAYFTYVQLVSFGTGSLGIVDTSEIQARKSGAKGTLVKEYDWQDGSTTQYPIPVTYRGKDYLIVTDELGSGTCNSAAQPPIRLREDSRYWRRDESEARLVAQDRSPGPCQLSGGHPAGWNLLRSGHSLLQRRSREGSEDSGLRPLAGGLRVYDISNPWRPTELAYMQRGTRDR